MNSNSDTKNEANDNDNEEEETEEKLVTNSPPKIFDAPTSEQLYQKNSQQMASFNELLDSISSTEDKQKSLWRQIYENAITDRVNAYITWADLFKDVQGRPSEHGIHGQNLSRYMERMSKANDQLIKLAELVGNAKKKDSSEITEESLYLEMESSTKTSKH
jgi:ethanolamine utilization protein EutQ (cupin superfamily)